MKMRLVTILVLITVFLFGCGKVEKEENPYRLKTQILEYYLDDETQTTRTEYAYDENGYLTETQTFYNDEWWYTTQFNLDTNGNTLSSETNYADGTKIKENVLTRDDQGRMITSEKYLNGHLDTTTEYGYNEDGQITKRYSTYIDILKDEDWVCYVEMTYDHKGNLIREDNRWEPANNNSYTLFFYEKDRLIRKELYCGDRLDSYTEYTFSENGLVQTAIGKNMNGVPQSKHITTFDEYDNPLEVVAYASKQVRIDELGAKPDSRTINVYEPIQS